MLFSRHTIVIQITFICHKCCQSRSLAHYWDHYIKSHFLCDGVWVSMCYVTKVTWTSIQYEPMLFYICLLFPPDTSSFVSWLCVIFDWTRIFFFCWLTVKCMRRPHYTFKETICYVCMIIVSGLIECTSAIQSIAETLLKIPLSISIPSRYLIECSTLEPGSYKQRQTALLFLGDLTSVYLMLTSQSSSSYMNIGQVTPSVTAMAEGEWVGLGPLLPV